MLSKPTRYEPIMTSGIHLTMRGIKKASSGKRSVLYFKVN
jgi:hypothetical protein